MAAATRCWSEIWPLMVCKWASPDDTLCRVVESLREFSFISRCRSAFSLCNLRMPAVLGAVVFALSWRGSGRRRSFADLLCFSLLFPEECPAFFDDGVLFCAEAADLGRGFLSLLFPFVAVATSHVGLLPCSHRNRRHTEGKKQQEDEQRKEEMTHGG